MADKDDSMQLVTFQLGEEYYGIDIMDVQEIVRLRDVRGIPNSPGYVEGIINLRGEIIPVINLHHRFNLPHVTLTEQDQLLSGFVIIDLRGTKLGMLIDRVSRVVTVQGESIQPPPRILSGIGKEYIRGVASEEEAYLIILDIRRIFDPRELQQLGTISA